MHSHGPCRKSARDCIKIQDMGREDIDRRCITKMETDANGIQGKLYIRGDSKIFRFQNGKTESLFLQRKNPRKISWTTLYRRQHKKGISEVRYLSGRIARAYTMT